MDDRRGKKIEAEVVSIGSGWRAKSWHAPPRRLQGVEETA
jgi:hypothetical protein